MSNDNVTIAHDLRAAFFNAAMSNTAPPDSVLDLRILGTLVGGGAVPAATELESSLGVCDLSGWRRDHAMADKLVRSVGALQLWPVVDLEHALLPIVAQMRVRGVPIDGVRWGELRAARSRALDDARATVRRILGVRYPEDHRAVLRALRARGITAQGTGKDELSPHRQRPGVEAVIRFNALNAFAHDHGPNVHAALCGQPDGRIRADIDPLGTITGRFSIAAPNLLGLEKAASVRRCVVPERGHVIISTDLRAAELRVLAGLRGEERLIEAFRQGRDPHSLTAGLLFGVAPERIDKRQRNVGKITNFAIVFGGSADTIMRQCLAAGLQVSADEASEFFGGFCDAYPAIAAGLDTAGKDLSTARSALGRIRSFPAPHAAAWLNAPVQMTAADAIKFAMLDVAPRLADLGAHLLLCVHDELVVEAPLAVAERAAATVREGMVRQCEETLGGIVPFAVDQFFGPTWAESDATWTWTAAA